MKLKLQAGIRDIPRENDWHTGIIFFEKGQLKWKNEAGVEWNLQPDINNNKLITGEDNPYQTEYEPDFRLIKSSEKSKSVSQSEEYPTVSIEESYEDILLKSARIDAKQKISGFRFSQAKYHKMVKKDGVFSKSAPMKLKLQAGIRDYLKRMIGIQE